jgi:hypothetical protein
MTEAEQKLWCRIVENEIHRQAETHGSVDMEFVALIADTAIEAFRKRMSKPLRGH